MRSLSLNEIIKAVSGKSCGNWNVSAINGVSTDARSIQPGELFFALKGEKFDGHNFVTQALDKGAAGAIVSYRPESVSAEAPLIHVVDSLVAYGDLAAYYRSLFQIPVIAVTGSVGKTTAREMTARVLETRTRTLSNEGNFNNEIGVPKTLFRLTDEYESAVLEIAMRAPGEIRRLAEIVRPQSALITNIGITHIEILGTQDAIAEAKAEVIEFLTDDGTLFLNKDDDYFEFLSKRSSVPVVSFGTDPTADFSASEIEVTTVPGIQFLMKTPVGSIPICLQVPGRHNVYNALSAAAVGVRYGLDLESIRKGLADFTPGNMRMQLVQVGEIKVLNDCYNASPASMSAALDILRDYPGAERSVAVLGDMKELGQETRKAHLEMGAKAAECSELLFTVGELGDIIAEGAISAGMPDECVFNFKTNVELTAVLVELMQPGDVILVKGSRAMQMEQIVQGISG